MAIKVWSGASTFDGAPISAYITSGSANSKTGSVDTLWIMADNIDPVSAIKTGSDISVCGDCRHRGSSCYVNAFQAPLNIYKNASGKAVETFYPSRPIIRLCGYGDAAMLPYPVVAAIASRYKTVIGYSHGWQWCDRRFQDLLLASVDSEEERGEAAAQGWRTFRVRSQNTDKLPTEVTCINEIDKLITCDHCKLCSAKHPRNRDVVVTIHGLPYKIAAFNRG